MCSLYPIRWCTNPICPISDNIYSDELIKMVLAKFLHCKVSFSLCNELFVGLNYLLLGRPPNSDFENSIIPSTFISGTSYTVRRRISFMWFMVPISITTDSWIPILCNG